jgi:hypothetical protein
VPLDALPAAIGRFRPPLSAGASRISARLVSVCVVIEIRAPVCNSCSGLRLGRVSLLCPRLTSANPSQHLAMPVAQGRSADLPGYCAPTFTLMPAASTTMLSVQVSDFEDSCLLIQHDRLLCDFCSSGQRFACSFLQIPPRSGHPCRPANTSPCRVCRGLDFDKLSRVAPPSECALPGAQHKGWPKTLSHPLKGGQMRDTSSNLRR